MKSLVASIMMAVVVVAILVSGCTSSYGGQPQTTAAATPVAAGSSGAPSLTITSPQNGATLPAGSVTVTTQVSNFNVVDKQGQASVAGEGHLHFYMDVSPIPTAAGVAAIPADKNAVWAHVSGTSYTFSNVPAGMHTFSVELANNDHTPVQPPVVQSVMVNVQDASAPASAATPSAAPAAAAASGSGPNVQLTLTCQNIAFDKSSLTAPAGSHVTMTFVNNDAGVAHNFALYTDSSATSKIFVGSIINGVATTTYTFDAPSTPGTYFYRCDVHPTIMYGTFVVS